MDASLDNANNPFAIPNGAPTDNIISQKSDGLLLNLTDNFKQNGTDISPTADFYPKEKSNGKRSASEFDDEEDDEDFGPETDVDAVDDVLSPAADAAKGFGDVFANNNPSEGVCNPFIEHQEKAALEIERELQKQQSAEAEEPIRLAREETPTPPADAVHDVSGLVENAAESDSEDEWNYIKGDDANKENISPHPEKEVAEVPEEDEAMSQLNPNAAEFIPVSPTRSIPSPACRSLLNDQVISQSPRRAVPIDINVPNPVEFEKEVKSRPSEVDSYSNGHDESDNVVPSTTDLMENLLNGKNIDEIPEFHPGSTPSKVAPSDEFHFGPNAAPFTPGKFLDQSETGLSTKAVFGDESSATLGTSFNESVASSQDTAADLNLLNKESDPMSMSFYADKGESNPFDLNEVHVLPDNLDEFLNKSDNVLDDTISDLPEHDPLAETRTTINNDDAVQITDLDKQSYDDEKELASPLEPEKELSEVLTGAEECEQSKTPEPTHENLLGGQEFCQILEAPLTASTEPLPRDVELISPEPGSKQSRPESSHENFESESPAVPEEATEVPDLLQSQSESLPRDVELISPESSRPGSSLTHEEAARSPQPEATEVEDLLRTESKSPAGEATEVNDLLGRPDSVQSKSPLPEADSKSPLPEVESVSPAPEACKLPETESDVSESKSPIGERFDAESPVCELRPESKSPVCELPVSKSPVCELESAKSPVCERPISESPVCQLRETASPVFDQPILESPVCERPVSESPVCERPISESPVCERPVSESPVCERPVSESPVCERPVSESPVCERPVSESPVCERPVSESPRPISESPVCGLGAASPVCERPASKSPLPELEVSKSPVPELEIAESPIPELEVAKSPVPQLEVSESPVAELEETKSPVPEVEEATQPLVCDIAAANLLAESEAKSPVPQAPLTPDFTKEEEIERAQEHFEIICKSPEDLGEITPDFTNQDEIRKAQEHFEEVFKIKEQLESPQEDVTSSLKDEASPIVSPIPIESSLADQTLDIAAAAAQEVSSIQESSSVVEATPSPTPEIEISESCPIASPTPAAETEIEPEPAAEKEFEQRSIPDVLELSRPLSPPDVQTLSAQAGEQIDIKTENITPEFAEQAIVTPSEESKQEDVPSAPPAEELVPEPVAEEKKAEEQKEAVGVTEVVAAAAAVGAAAVAAAVAPAVAKSEKDEKKKPASPTKKPTTTKSTAAKPTPKTTAAAPKTSSRLSASPRVAATKTSAAKPSPTATTTTSATSRPSATRISPRPKPSAPPAPKTAAAAPKSTDKKPLTNGDVKSTVRSTLSARKISSETTTTAAKSSHRPTTMVGATRTSPTKPAAPKPFTSTRPASATTKTTTTTTRVTSSSLTSAAPRPRPPSTLTHKTTTSSTVTKTAAAPRAAPTKTSPRPAPAAPKPRPPPTTTVLKQRAPLTKTITKAPDTEKQNKESANKLTASRTMTRTTATARSATSTVRKVESKVSATRTSKTTTTTTTKSTTAKKPAEIVRNATTKTKTTKVEKPKENGVATVVSEEIITITTGAGMVNITTGSFEQGESQLLKDNSPLDNKLIVDSVLIETNTVD